MKLLAVLVIAILVLGALPVAAKVAFDSNGVALVNGVRFFPIGVYLYDLNTDILAEVHQQGFNTVVHTGMWNSSPKDLELLRGHGLMTMQPPTDEWLKAKDDPCILAWYLRDEPEMSQSVEEFHKDYVRVKAADPDHPIGTCHYDWDAMKNYKDSEDYLMISSYPVVAKRTVPMSATGMNIDYVHGFRGKSFPIWPCIQTFGGAESDGGLWAVPTPAEVRCMTYEAVVHGAQGVLFFSYWPQAPRTWSEVGVLCKELHRLTPFFVVPGKDIPVSCDDKAVHMRCIQVGSAGIVMAVNTEPTFKSVHIKLDGVPTKALAMPFEGRRMSINKGSISERFMPYEVHVYQWGETPFAPSLKF